MAKAAAERDAWRECQVLAEVDRDENISQRDLARLTRLNVAVINQIVKRLVRRGWLETQRINASRVAYYLTPKGFKERARLVMRYTRRTISLFTTVRQLLNEHLAELRQRHKVETVVLVGANELTEAAYLSVREQHLHPVAVYNDMAGPEAEWLGLPVYPLSALGQAEADVCLVTELELPPEGEKHLPLPHAHMLNLGELLSQRLVDFAKGVEGEE